MATQKDVKPSSDQPKVTTQSLKRMDAPASLQYRVSGIKSTNARKPKRTARGFGR